MCECCRQVEAEVVSKSRNKIHQTWGPPINGALYIRNKPSAVRIVVVLPMTRPRTSCASLSSLYISPRARTGEGLRRSKDQGGIIEGAEGGSRGTKETRSACNAWWSHDSSTSSPLRCALIDLPCSRSLHTRARAEHRALVILNREIARIA